MTPLHISLIGTFQITKDGAAVTGIESERGRALRAYLAVEAARPHRREALAALLWPETSQSSAAQNLRHAIYNLRQALENDAAGVVLLVVMAAVAGLLADRGAVLQSEDRISYQRAVDFAHGRLGEADFERAWQQGLTMSLQQAIDYALQRHDSACGI